MAAPGLWQQASAFASGAEARPGRLARRLSRWRPACSAGGCPPWQADAVARWLPAAADRIPPELLDVALGIPLGQPDGTLADERLRRPARSGQAAGQPGPGRAPGTAAGRPGARAYRARRAGDASRLCALRPRTARAARSPGSWTRPPPATALAALDWASASGISVPDAELERYGRTRLDPATPEELLARTDRFLPGHPARAARAAGRRAARGDHGGAGGPGRRAAQHMMTWPGIRS